MSLETRKTVSLALDNKSNLDYDSILNTCDDMRNSFAAGDIFTSKSVPFLKNKSPSNKNINWLYNGPRLAYNSESELLSLTRGRSMKKPSAANVAKEENFKITQAFELLATAKHSVDTPKIYYEVANLYMDISMLVMLQIYLYIFILIVNISLNYISCCPRCSSCFYFFLTIYLTIYIGMIEHLSFIQNRQELCLQINISILLYYQILRSIEGN